MKGNVLSALAGVVVCAAFLVAGGSAAPPKTCTLTPTLRDITVNQGLQTYSALVRGKETLVRLYLSLPSCAVSGNSVQISRVSLTMGLKDAATSAAVGTPQTFSPTPSLGSPLPQITNLFSNPPLTEMAPSDRAFIVPGSTLSPVSNTSRLVATFSASIDWQSVSPTGQSATGTALTSTTAGTPMTKTIEKQTRAMRLLVVPLGRLLDTAGTTAIQNGMTALSRLYPVPDGMNGSRVGSLTGTDGGIRYTINSSFLDLGALGISLPFCGNATTFGSSSSGLIDTQLSQFRQSWNSANPNTPADNVVGAIGESQSVGSATNANCDEARAAVNGREAWVRAVSDKSTTLSAGIGTTDTALTVNTTAGFPTTAPFGVLVDNEVVNVTSVTPGSVTTSWGVTRGAAAAHVAGATVTLLSTTGALLAMELEHNYGYVPATRGDANFHSLYAHADHSTGDANRGYNVSGRQYLPDNRSNMRFTPPGWTNLTTLLDPADWAGLLCNLGGATTSECSTAATTGTVSGVAAGLSDPAPVPSFVMSGTTDGTQPGTHVLESYVASTLPTPIDSASSYHLVQLPSGRDDIVPVSFNVSNHNASEPPTSSSVGLFSVAVPLVAGTTRIELRNGSGAVLYFVNKQNTPPTISTGPPITLRALSTSRPTRAARTGGPVPTTRASHPAGHRTLAGTGDLVRSITVSPAPTCSPLISVGVAYDGSDLMVSCTSNNVITRVDPVTGANRGSLTISGVETIGAMSWDANHGKLWLATADGSGRVYSATIDKPAGTGTATLAFTSANLGLSGFPIIDGLAYDGTDNTLWASPDISSTVYHLGTTGNLIGSFPASLGGCGNSGIAVADAHTLYLANDGCSQIWSANKDGSSTTLFAGLSARVEDLECDGSSVPGKNVLWSKDAYDWILTAFEMPSGQCAQGGVPSVDYTIDSGGANVTSDLFLKCPNSPVYNVVRVAIPGTDVSIPQTVGCAGGQFYAEAYDGFSSSGTLTQVAPSTLADPPTLPFQPSATSPYPGQSYSVNDNVSLVGSAFDYATGTAATLQWLSDGNPIAGATGQQADLRASTLSLGSHTITLRATSGSTTADLQIPITISNDADGDGISVAREQVIHDCAVSKGITTDGGDSDPTNGTTDYDRDGIPNRDDPFPCTPAGSYTAAAAVFLPNPLSLSGNATLSAGGVYVPLRNMTQVIPPKGSLPNVFIKEIGLGEAGTIPVNQQATGYAASGSIGAATFARQPLIGILSANSIVNRTVTLTITGTGNDPLTGPWTFTAVVSTYVTP
jgi:hypothetical protein